jgi:hypothetical protein
MSSAELRELDAWIAKHVMGCELEKEIGFRYNDGTESWGNSPEYTVQKFNKYKSEGIADCLLERPNTYEFQPSTDPAAAMMVLEKCGTKTEPHECMYMGMIDGEWIVGHSAVEASASTLPLAICLFAKQLFEK